MSKMKIFLIALAAIFTFLLVYSPHFHYPFPSHIDEWHHISETIRLQEGEYSGGFKGLRLGFNIVLLLLSKIANLVSIYRFLPASWAVFSALILFYVVYKKTGDQFYIALFAMIFFASMKSNVNITGLWFFTPLSLSIPFIFLYIYFLTEGIEKHNKKFIFASLAIMIILLPIHAISVLFALPFLVMYILFNLGYIKKEWKFFSCFLTIPLIGMAFYKFMLEIPWKSSARDLIQRLQFKHGWGVLELDNSFFELYSLIGYILAVIGLIFVFADKKNLKKYLAYGLWPITVLISIIIYRITGVSYLSPYQRNLYYFAIGLPILSAFGLDNLFKLIKEVIIGTGLTEKKKDFAKKAGITALLVIILVLTFAFYFDIPRQVDLYKIIEDDREYRALSFLSDISPKSVVMAMPRISTALYAISQHEPVATYFFYGNRPDAERFFYTEDCQIKEQILDEYDVKYVLSESRIQCGWKLIYNKGMYIYEIY